MFGEGILNIVNFSFTVSDRFKYPLYRCTVDLSSSKVTEVFVCAGRMVERGRSDDPGVGQARGDGQPAGIGHLRRPAHVAAAPTRRPQGGPRMLHLPDQHAGDEDADRLHRCSR